MDVVVAGAGPAGCAAAMVLARAGHRVLLADPRIGHRQRLKIGETLPAVALTALRDLGIGPELIEAAGGRPSAGTTSAWGSDEPWSHDAIFDLHGHGWHLDRNGFDAMLLDAARAAGARMRAEKARVHDGRGDDAAAARSRGGATGVRVRVGDEEIVARHVVDATGRAAAIARGFGARHARADRLVAVYARVVTPPADVDARTRVEAAPGGWWYSALAAQRRVVAFLTDADLLEPTLRTRAGFAAALARAHHVLPASSEFALETDPAATAAHGTILSPCEQDGWLAVGDAALAFDPLSSQGILNALVTGMLGAGTVVDRLGGRRDANGSYGRLVADVWAAYEANRADAYALEQRWPQRPFWARRVAR